MLTTRLIAALGALIAAASGVASAAGERETARITVFAASSLTSVLPKIDSRPRYSFAASNALAQQIRQGAPADVFASADVRNPRLLRAAGLCREPRVFATNSLVVVVPKANPGKVRSVGDLGRLGVKVVVAQRGVPVGDYTRTMLANLGIARAVLANVVSQEPDVRSVLAKVALGEADAGFVYRTDAATVKGQIGVVTIRATAQPSIRYAVCAVSSSRKQAEAHAFVTRLVGKTGRARVSAAGFGLP